MALSAVSKRQPKALPLSILKMVDLYAARSVTPHHTAFALEYGVRSRASLCAEGPLLLNDVYHYEWQDQTLPFYDAEVLYVEVSVCHACPCVLCSVAILVQA